MDKLVQFTLAMRDKVTMVAKRIRNQMKGLDDSITKTRNRFAKFNQSAVGLGLNLFSAFTAMDVGRNLLTIASDANELNNQFKLLYGTSAPSVLSELERIGSLVGRGEVDLMGYASTFKALADGMGFSQKDASQLSTTLTQVGLDLASFYNLSDTDAMERLTSGLKGNHENLETFNVFISEARLNQELMNMGLAGGASAASEQQKMLARLGILLHDTALSQGDAVRTGHEFAGSLRGVMSMGRDLARDFGTLLLPMATSFIHQTQKLVAWLLKLSPAQQKVVFGIAAFAVVGLPAISMLGFLGSGLVSFITSVTAAPAALAAFRATMMTSMIAPIRTGITTLFTLARAWLVGLGPIGWVIGAILLLGSVLVYAYNKFPWFRDAVNEAWSFIKMDAGSFQDWWSKAFTGDWLEDAFTNMFIYFDNLPTRFMGYGQNLILGFQQGFTSKIQEVQDAVTGFASGISDSVKNFFGIQSPSKLFAYYGQMLPAGFEKGYSRETTRLNLLSIPAPLPAYGGGAGVGSMTNYFTITSPGNPTQVAEEVRVTLLELFDEMSIEVS
jgi:hypothetical protein